MDAFDKMRAEGKRELAQMLLDQYVGGREHWNFDEDMAEIARDLISALRSAAGGEV